MATLEVWMNGQRVGEWISRRPGSSIFCYTQSWVDRPNARPISLSLPITADRQVKGEAVDHYFDNLLPDNPDIRRRIRERFRLRSTSPFDLLAAVGRDCVGAVQLLPPGKADLAWNQVNATPLTRAEIARLLRRVAGLPNLGSQEDDDDDFRISIAGAQEKTALLQMGGTWYRPRGATPTTHILKLPLGIIGPFRGDFSDSVENEWLCSEILRTWGLPIAETRVATFEDQKALVIKRFDRRWIGADEDAVRKRGFQPPPGAWIARLPQEDLCQAMGRPPTERYENEGGPSMNDVLTLLAGSEDAEVDTAQFMLSQLAFWLLAAIDGHAKNFSIHLRAGDAFTLTPLYDVLSAWPVIGHGVRKLAVENAKLAMAVPSKSRHYRLHEIHARHWRDLAERVGGARLWQRAEILVDEAPAAFRKIARGLPANFPESVFESIRTGVERQRGSFLNSLVAS